MTKIRKGSQVPTYTTVREWAYTDGDYAAEMFGKYGIRFYESQRHELQVFLARTGNGEFSSKTICISKPRQNGKSFAARFYAIWMAAIEGRHVLFSAHHGGTVRKMFKEIKDFVTKTPDFAEMLKPNRQGIYAAKGSEGIYFVDENGHDAGMIEFQTRTTSGARGETYMVIIVDEAQELTDEQLEAIKPTTLAAAEVTAKNSDPQMIYLGTPPNEKCPGTVFRDYHDRAHSNPASSIWWMEWAVADVPDMSDPEAVLELAYRTNPAMGYRIKESTMRDFIDTMSADGFARECLGWWSATAANAIHPIRAKDWDECRIDENDRPSSGVLTYAVRFDPEGSTCAIAACVADGESAPYVEVVFAEPTRGSVSSAFEYILDVFDNADATVIDGQGMAQTLSNRMLAEGVDEDRLTLPKTAEVVEAYATFASAVSDHNVSHVGRAGLDEAAKGCVRRAIGKSGGFGFESAGNADATLVDACALAHWKALELLRTPDEEPMEVW